MQTAEERAAYYKNWRLANKDKGAASTKKYRSKPGIKDKLAAAGKRWKLANPSKVAAHHKNYELKNPVAAAYRTLRRAAQGQEHATKEELEFLLELQDGFCGLTLVKVPEGINMHLDHTVPAAKGGAHTIDNLRWVHPMANYAKQASTDKEFLTWWNNRKREDH